MDYSSVRSTCLVSLALVLAATGCHVLDFSPRYAPGEIVIFDDLFAVSVPDDTHAVAVGYHGSAYWTEDAGETWHKGETGTNHLLYSVSMADAKRGWAVGQLGTILRTVDGGRSWESQPNPKVEQGSHLFGIHAIDADTAWCVGEWGTRIFTEDGGETWQDHSLTIGLHHPMFVWLSLTDQDRVREGKDVYEDVGLNYVFCLDPPSEKCWHIGEFGYIFYSDDRGHTWERAEIVGDVRVDPIVFPYNQIEIGEEEAPRLREFAAQIEDATHLNVLLDPFASEKELAVFGKADDPTELFDILSARIDETRSVLEEAGVLSDRLRIPNKPPWDYEDFLEDDPAFLERYLEGRRAEQSVIEVSVIQNPYLFTVYFEDEQNGLIAGLGGVILTSADGGRTWIYRETDRKQAFFSVEAKDGRAIAVGEKGLIRFSTDHGRTWRPPPEDKFPTIFTFMRDIAFDDTQRVGFIVGQEGMVLRSRDRGESWSQVLPPPSRRAGEKA